MRKTVIALALVLVCVFVIASIAEHSAPPHVALVGGGNLAGTSANGSWSGSGPTATNPPASSYPDFGLEYLMYRTIFGHWWDPDTNYGRTYAQPGEEIAPAAKEPQAKPDEDATQEAPEAAPEAAPESAVEAPEPKLDTDDEGSGTTPAIEPDASPAPNEVDSGEPSAPDTSVDTDDNAGSSSPSVDTDTGGDSGGDDGGD